MKNQDSRHEKNLVQNATFDYLYVLLLNNSEL